MKVTELRNGAPDFSTVQPLKFSVVASQLKNLIVVFQSMDIYLAAELVKGNW